MTRRVVLLSCGSFNPPTMMHLRMMEVARDYLREQLSCTVLEGIYSPTSDCYAKPGLASQEHRCAMLECATNESDWTRVDRWEATRDEWTRTCDVMAYHRNAARAKYGMDVELLMVAGGDLVDTFTRLYPDGSTVWEPDHVKEIVEDYGIVVLKREGSNPAQTLLDLNLTGGHFVEDDVCPCDISSTRVRAAIRAGRSIKYAAPDAVIRYIEKHQLYRL